MVSETHFNTSKGSIYRYTSFDSLVDMVQRQALAFITHDLWEDPYEGFVFKALKTEEGKQQILGILKEVSPELAPVVYGTLLKIGSCIHAQSWTECSENDALWRIYSNNNRAVRAEILLEDVEKIDKVSAHKIDYSGYNSLRDEIKSILDAEKRRADILPILLKKRPSFSYEQEIRLVSDIDLNFLPVDRSQEQITQMEAGLRALHRKGEITDKELDTGMKSISSEKRSKIKHIKFDHIDNFIRSVVVHPLSPDWFVETVNMFCVNNNLCSLGKSKLYTFEITQNER